VIDERTAELRRAIYRFFADHTRAPTREELGASQEEFEALERTHAIVGDHDGRIRFSNPFAAGPTDFEVSDGSKRWYATCAWDGLGILAATGRDGDVTTTCSDCSASIVLRVAHGRLEPVEAVAHFLVPAAEWYRDLSHT
jgi:hypothetical protein